MSPSRETGQAGEEGNVQTLVCFAVREEAKHFNPDPSWACKVILTGIGPENARNAIARALTLHAPRLVLTCGYAGGLNPILKCGDVVYDTEVDSGLGRPLNDLGAFAGTFHRANQIAITVIDKRRLHQETKADAVEMESGLIRSFCHERGIAAATIRVISDDASTDLPLDFNKLSKADGNISYIKLAAAIVRTPRVIPKLKRFQRDLDLCSRKLAAALEVLLGESRCAGNR